MFENMTYDNILQRMLSRVSDKLDKREGSVIFDTHSPTALEIQFLYIQLERIIKESFGDTASREFLILRCRERGIEPYPAENAVLKGNFYPPDINAIGKRFNGGGLNYTVTEKISEGQYKLRCDQAGTQGNRYLGALVPIDHIDGLKSAELEEVLIPGEDEEETEELRKRYFSSFDEKAYGGNIRDYTEKTNALAGVGKCKVERAWNGNIHPSDMIPSEDVTAWYNNIKDSLSGNVKKWLDTVFLAAKEKKLTTGGAVLLTIINSDFRAASDALLQKVGEAADPDMYSGEGYGFAPIGHVVRVQSAEEVSVFIETDLAFESGYGWNNLKERIEEEISVYLSELRKEWADSAFLTVRISRIETRLLGIKGILDIGNTRINGNTDNLILGKHQIPVFGGVDN